MGAMHSILEYQRNRSIELLREGERPAAIAPFLPGVSCGSVRKWQRMARDGEDLGEEADTRTPLATDRRSTSSFGATSLARRNRIRVAKQSVDHSTRRRFDQEALWREVLPKPSMAYPHRVFGVEDQEAG